MMPIQYTRFLSATCLWLVSLLPQALNAQPLASAKTDSATVAVMYSNQFLKHNTGPHHPERPDRLSIVVDYIKHQQTLYKQLIWPNFRPATTAQLQLVHTPAYIQLVNKEVKALGRGKRAQLSTGDTVISPETSAVATLAVGAGVAASDLIMRNQAQSAFALVRPPGHHATSNRGMGFCVYNNVAIVAKHLQQQYGLKRILIVDFDVHHGNGTQDIFYNDGSVFYFSVHQSPLYPGTGDADEVGEQQGKGATMNVVLKAGDGDKTILRAINEQLKPAMKQFKPEFVLVSAGFDSHAGDLLGQLAYTDAGYTKIATQLSHIANHYAGGRILYVLEGGYVPENMAKSVANILGVLTQQPADIQH